MSPRPYLWPNLCLSHFTDVGLVQALLLRSHILLPCSSAWDINPAAVWGRALTFLKVQREVILCRQISPSRKIHQGERGEEHLGRGEFSGSPEAVLLFAQIRLGRAMMAAETSGTMRGGSCWLNRNQILGEWDRRSWKVRRGNLLGSLPPEAKGSVLAPHFPCTAEKGVKRLKSLPGNVGLTHGALDGWQQKR